MYFLVSKTQNKLKLKRFFSDNCIQNPRILGWGKKRNVVTCRLLNGTEIQKLEKSSFSTLSPLVDDGKYYKKKHFVFLYYFSADGERQDQTPTK